jgi:phosphoribosylformylglycinamidine synthase
MARLTVAEMVTNIMWARLTSLADVKASGNWMWAAKLVGEGARVWDACEALRDALLAIGAGIDGGKDSLSMAAGVGPETVKAPGMLTLTAYCTCPDLTMTVTPDLKKPGSSALLLIDLDVSERCRLGGSSLAHVYGQLGNDCPDLEDMSLLVRTFEAIQALIAERAILAGHDRSDGGLMTTLLEMAFAGNCGLDLDIGSATQPDPIALLFNEEIGIVIEVDQDKVDGIVARLSQARVPARLIGRTTKSKQIKLNVSGAPMLDQPMVELRDIWEATSFELEKRQRVPSCVEQEQKGLASRSGPSYKMTFSVADSLASAAAGARPRVAVLRQEGSNGDREMAAAFHYAGLEAWDVTVSDLLQGRVHLSEFRGLVFVGGFSYADVLDSGKVKMKLMA